MPRGINAITLGVAVYAVKDDPALRERLVREHLSVVPRAVAPAAVTGTGVGASLDQLLRQRGVAIDCDLRKLAEQLDREGPAWAEANWRTLADQLRPISISMLFAAIKRVQAGPTKLILTCGLSPGDILTLTAAIRSLHVQYPGRYLTDVRTPVPEIWEHNPDITPIEHAHQTIEMHYPAINASSQRSVPFLAGYTEYLGDQLGLPLRLVVNRPQLYLSDEERGWISQIEERGHRGPFLLVNAGVKSDYPTKQWPLEHYQEVINATCEHVQWVQIGSAEHDHEPLDGVIDLRGQTTHRQLIRLVYHCRGGLGPVTYLQHLCAAWQKPYICLLGGREATTWVQYPLQQTLHTMGQLPCCQTPCWKSRVMPLADEDAKNSSLCEQPIVSLRRPAAKCMAMIRPQEVVALVERMLL
jgi:ADP-heptose:LPS heptosyltransferase